MTETPFVLKEISTLDGEHKKPPYSVLNPTGSIPVITHGKFKVLGTGQSMYIGFLASTNNRIRDAVY